MLRVSAVKDDVGKQIDGPRKVFAHHGGIIYGLLLGGIGVQVAAYALQPVGDVAGTPAVRTLKSHVFYKMSHAAVGSLLVACAGTHHVSAIRHPRGQRMVITRSPLGSVAV